MERRHFLLYSISTLALAQPALAISSRTSTFQGQNGHTTSGNVEIVQENGEYVVKFKDNFFFDGAPDPKVALGKNGYDPSTLMGALKKNEGSSSYKVPQNIDPDQYNEVWIWCEKFNVALGVAKL